MGCCGSTDTSTSASLPTVERKPLPEGNTIYEPVEVKPKPPLNPDEPTIKCVLVGDTSVGKSALITNYLRNSYSEDFEPTVLDVYRGERTVKKKKY